MKTKIELCRHKICPALMYLCRLAAIICRTLTASFQRQSIPQVSPISIIRFGCHESIATANILLSNNSINILIKQHRESYIPHSSAALLVIRIDRYMPTLCCIVPENRGRPFIIKACGRRFPQLLTKQNLICCSPNIKF